MGRRRAAPPIPSRRIVELRVEQLQAAGLVDDPPRLYYGPWPARTRGYVPTFGKRVIDMPEDFWDQYEKERAEEQELFDRAFSGDEKAMLVESSRTLQASKIYERETQYGNRFLVEVEPLDDDDTKRILIFDGNGAVDSRDRLLRRMGKALNRGGSIPIRLRAEGNMVLVERG